MASRGTSDLSGYHVHGVPRTVANDAVHVEGAVPEATLMAELLPMLAAHAALSS